MADERVIPGVTDVRNLQKHIARYNLALMFCEGKDVLDLSCGTGYGTFLISQVADYVVGVDIDEQAIMYANRYYNTFDSGDSEKYFYISDILDFVHEQVDTIVSFETIEHIKDLEALEKKFDSLLKPGGTIVYSVPLHENYHNEHHHHKFDLEKGLSFLSNYENQSYVVQKGMNFLPHDLKQPFTYLIVSKTKPL